MNKIVAEAADILSNAWSEAQVPPSTSPLGYNKSYFL
jgi:hypothetical protein